MSGAKQTIVTTAAVQAGKALQDNCGQQCVDWAIGLLAEGRDSEHLAMLAGQLPPFNHFEIAALRDRVLDESGVPNVGGKDAILMFAAERLRSALRGDANITVAVSEVSRLCIRHDYLPELYDFYMLDCARDDFEYGDVQYYWTGATRDNIASIMRDRAETFVCDYDAKE